MFGSIFVLLIDDLCDVMTIFVVYLLLPSVLLTTVYSVSGKVTGERIWKESRHHCCIFLQRLRESMETPNSIAGVPVETLTASRNKLIYRNIFVTEIKDKLAKVLYVELK
jgi:hypothetical protein